MSFGNTIKDPVPSESSAHGGLATSRDNRTPRLVGSESLFIEMFPDFAEPYCALVARRYGAPEFGVCVLLRSAGRECESSALVFGRSTLGPVVRVKSLAAVQGTW